MTHLINRNQNNPRSATSRTSDHWDPLHLLNAILRVEQEQDRSWPSRAAAFMPTFDVKETKDAYLIHADLPGVSETDLDITVTENALTVVGKRSSGQSDESERYYAMERGYGAFSRTFGLPDGANSDELSADLKNGVLTVHIPKRPEVQPRKISLGKAGGSRMVSA